MDKATKNGIKGSKVFLVLGTKAFFDGIPKQQVLLAKNLGKPFRVLLDIGVTVPSWFKEGVKDYKEKVTDLSLVGKTQAPDWLRDFMAVKS